MTDKRRSVSERLSNENARVGRDPTNGKRGDPVAAADVTSDPQLTVPETAERLQCSKATIRRRIASGALRTVKHGRVLRILATDLEAFIRTSRKWR